jgi:hypothetical protein
MNAFSFLSKIEALQGSPQPSLFEPSDDEELAAMKEERGKSGFKYVGVLNDTLPRSLLMDSRLSPIEVKCWMMIKLLINHKQFSMIRYEELQKYLSMSGFGKCASKETVARALLILRLTRWICLSESARNKENGQIQGCYYYVYDDPISLSTAVDTDASYWALVNRCRSHKNKMVQMNAELVMTEAEVASGVAKTEIDLIDERIKRANSAANLSMTAIEAPKVLPIKRGRKSNRRPSSDSELGLTEKNGPGSDAELGRNLPSTASERGSVMEGWVSERGGSYHGSESEHGKIPLKTQSSESELGVFNGTYSTYFNTYIKNVLVRTDDAVRRVLFPALSDQQKSELFVALRAINEAQQISVLNQTAQRMQRTGVANPTGYAMSLIELAKRGKLKDWKAPGITETKQDQAACHTALPHRTYGYHDVSIEAIRQKINHLTGATNMNRQ